MLAKNKDPHFSIRKRLYEDFEFYAGHCLKIRTKNGSIYPLTLNSAQKHLHERLQKQFAEKGRVRAIILKGRQQGISTYVEARFFWRVTHRKGIRAFILTHEEDATKNLFEMAQRYYEHCPEEVKPIADTQNAKELTFKSMDSGYKVGTAGNKATGRSATLQYFHGSEVAYWPNAESHAKGVLQSISDLNTEIILESTANGVGNYFYQQWQMAESGQSDFEAIFIPWFWQDEYRRKIEGDFVLTEEESNLKDLYKLDDEQLNWRRYKVIELSSNGVEGSIAFQQEYPCDAVEAFNISTKDALIQPRLVINARKAENVLAVGQLRLGVDPARFGDDRISIIRRKGRVAYGLESHLKKDTMEIAGRVHTIILQEKPDKVFVDVIGIGAGVVDRLIELGHEDIIVAVNGGESPLNAEKYKNKRAEMWGELNDWLKNSPVKIPDSDSLYSDLCGQKYDWTSVAQLKLVSKKEENLRSPDEADALALTFAEPVINQTIPPQAFMSQAKNFWSR